MRWVAPTEKDTANQTLEKRLWAAADQFRANSGLKAGQYSTPVLGLIFLQSRTGSGLYNCIKLLSQSFRERAGTARTLLQPGHQMAHG